METVTLVDLAPVLGIVLGSMLAFAIAIMRYMHVDSIKTRDHMHELINNSDRENRELIENSNRENRELIEKYHREVSGSLSEVRERLSHIEGFLRLWPPPPDHGGNPQAEAA